jgi:hypothetical protein
MSREIRERAYSGEKELALVRSTMRLFGCTRVAVLISRGDSFVDMILCQRLSLAYRSNQLHDLLPIAPSWYVASVRSFPGKHE